MSRFERWLLVMLLIFTAFIIINACIRTTEFEAYPSFIVYGEMIYEPTTHKDNWFKGGFCEEPIADVPDRRW